MSVGYADPIAETNVAIKSRTDGGAHVLARDIERLPGTVEADIGASKSFLETLASIVVTGRAAVDVSGTVEGYLQSLASAISAARMQTDVSTLPGTVAADIAALASAIASGSMKSVLQASTNVIGKLAANVGVNIGTVDVASMPASSQLPSALGQNAKVDSLSVSLASDQGALPITDNGGSLTVDGTVGVSGTVAVSAAALPLPASAAQEHVSAASPHAARLTDGSAFYVGAKTGQLPTALGQAAKAASVSVALASDQDIASTSSVTSVSASTSSVQLLAANSNRFAFGVWNDSASAILYVKLGTAASSSSYSAKLQPGGYYEPPAKYTGIVHGIWSAASGSARITELAA